jgi:hypothetical protein
MRRNNRNIDSDVRLNSPTDIISYLPRLLSLDVSRHSRECGLKTERVVTQADAGRSRNTFHVPVLCSDDTVRVEQQTELRSLAAVSNSFHRNDVVGSGGRKRGAMFRFRYVFWMLVIVLGVEGLRKKRSSADFADYADSV